ncbi:MAG: MBL fold metallo-hydrolase [Alphaproteobacteria bacterium]|nr:MBL fold metallo-hydrolase [Alphaproteobacteria bacterium]
MAFLTETEPQRGVAETVLPGIRRVVANNPGRMTYHGTNTYLFDTSDGLVILDPGPEEYPAHVEAVLRATGDKHVKYILLSHTHHDHFGAIADLKKATGAPTVGFHISGDERFEADIKLAAGDSIAGLIAIHTPGHAADHLCFAMQAEDGKKVLFSADHVMSWSSSIVSPPGGNMREYFASLELLLSRGDDYFLPGHGPKLPDPRDLVRNLLAHRMMREQGIAKELSSGASYSTYTLMDTLYSQTHPNLRRAAERNVLAHLLKLEEEGKAVCTGELWRSA